MQHSLDKRLSALEARQKPPERTAADWVALLRSLDGDMDRYTAEVEKYYEATRAH